MKEQLQSDTMQHNDQRTCMAYRMQLGRSMSAKMHDNRLRPFYAERVPMPFVYENTFAGVISTVLKKHRLSCHLS